MKKYLYLLFAILLITNVTAISNNLIAGGNNTITTIDECSFLRVNIEGQETIDEGEYNFPHCEEVEENKWYCQCIPQKNYELIMDVNLLAYNTYDFYIEVYGIEPILIRRSGGGTRTVYVYENDTEKEDPVKEDDPIIEKVYVNQTETIIEIKEVPRHIYVEDEPQGTNWWVYLAFGGLLLLIIMLIIYFGK